MAGARRMEPTEVVFIGVTTDGCTVRRLSRRGEGLTPTGGPLPTPPYSSEVVTVPTLWKLWSLRVNLLKTLNFHIGPGIDCRAADSIYSLSGMLVPYQTESL